ncbi:IS110 family transposase [Pseudarthrobacter sp. HLT3-5]|uniref:IS110 family transposase n=1 Tax=Pseudarthrobacter cellobiosi TaxID=2953654 RepID=UPI00208ED10B|nr:IS110 family transposase [Pseudarthrobacter sp. HLT3-5]MCO4273956.1 IS110 family transposase [Pseudarthrobacter sp. HLT3-5]
MLAETQDEDQIIARVAAIDIGKAELVCCVRVPAEGDRKKRLQEVSTHSTMTRSLMELANHLVDLRIERVVMEATSDYWKPVFYLLEAHGLEPWLVNARDVKHLPGRPKTDVLDSVWLCKVAERQMLRPSFVPPAPIRRLRDLTRYRADLVGTRTAEKNRVEKLLEDACIKLSSVASDIFGVSGREMMAALIAGERNPSRLAQLARSRMRGKISELEEAFTGRFDDHHRFLLARMLARIDGIDADIAAIDEQIEAQLAPFAAAAERLDEIPGIGPVAAAAIIAEIGVDMSRFPTAGHLCSWAKFSPGINSSAGKTKGNGSTGHGNRYLARILGEAAVGASKTHTFLGERHQRLARRRGKKRAIVATGRSILVIIWHLLENPDARFNDLGPDYFSRHTNPETSKRNHIRQLEALGYTVTLAPAA